MDNYDVVIIGGGPAGSTCGTLLKKYQPNLRVAILEREQFPRDHVGESQLPMICHVLDEMGVWDKVEAANFPIKIGATYRWGRSEEPWDFEFVPGKNFDDAPRPGKFEGVRRETAFQVDRSVYDHILLNHAQECGVDVRQSTKVAEVLRDGDRVTGVRLVNGETLSGRYFVDASGNAGTLRRAMDVAVDSPTALRNVAIWDYWQNADWAVEIGTGGTRIQIMSLGYGWIWFIPIGPTRTSIGLVLPASYYRDSKRRPEDLYLEALQSEPRIAKLIAKATREERLASTKDWSYVADRTCGENWFLAGESAGFADPILSAGMTLAHTGAREAAYTILALDRGDHDAGWLKDRYNETQRARLKSHIQFADFWYTGNGLFSDLRENTSNIAAEAGLKLNADEAFRWLSTGGFTNDTYDAAKVATWDVTAMKILSQHFSGDEATWQIGQSNMFELDLADVKMDFVPILSNGVIDKVRCYRRDGKIMPNHGYYRIIITALRRSPAIGSLIREIHAIAHQSGADVEALQASVLRTLEAMVAEGWVKATYDPDRARLNVKTPEETELFHKNVDTFREPAGAV